MAGDRFERTTFAELISEGALEIGDGYRAKNEELGGDGLMFLRAGHVTDTHIDFDGVERFHKDLELRLRSKLSKPGDAVITTKGNSTGRTTFVSPSMPPFVYSPHLSYWRSLDPTRVEGGFLRYWSKGPEFADQLAGMKASTDMAPYLSLVDQKRLRITLPPVPEQRAIAHILGRLDDKIELNRRMNETLEAMARALFKSWFVDFDPVRAKAEGRDPGLPQSLADLFPDRFEDSELGEIPKSWETHRLADLLSLEKGLSYKGEFLTDVGVPMVTLGCFLGRGRFAEEGIKSYSGEFQARHIIRPGDLVLANTDITQKREVIGSPALVPPRHGVSKLIFTHHVFAVRFHEGKEPWKLFVYFLLLQEGFRERAAGFATGTTVLALPRDAVLDLPCPVPPRALVEGFDSVVSSVIERHWKHTEQSRTLAALRDALLPKLISGKLRVMEPQRVIAADSA